MDLRRRDRRMWRCYRLRRWFLDVTDTLQVCALLLVLSVVCSCVAASAASAVELSKVVLAIPAAPTADRLEADAGISRRTDLSRAPVKRDHIEVQMLYPERGKPTPATTLFRCLVRRQFQLLAEEDAFYYQKSSACRVCVEVDGWSPPLFCMRPMIHGLRRAGAMQEQLTPVHTLPIGNHSARCFVSCRNDATADRSARIESESVSFSVVPDAWWSSSTETQLPADGLQNDTPSLVIGVKTSMRWGLPLRQAIRETWASATSLPSGVRVVFLGCRVPFEASGGMELARQTMAYGIELERSAHNDLLIDELGDCEDSYEDLVGKVAAFFRYVTTRYTASAPTAMVTDDDVYIDVHRLMRLVSGHLSSSQECVYAGQVWEEQFNLPVEPVRDRNSKYYVSEEAYPMKHWPPFAFGPHYLLSWECLGFILVNQRLFGEFRGLDDVTIAMWLLASGVHPQHVPQFKNLRDSPCLNDDKSIISLADVSTTALRAIHRNLRSGRPFCHGSDLSAWLR